MFDQTHKYTEEEIKDMIPRLENGKLDIEKFHSKDNPWKTHRVDINPYLTKDDVNELFKEANRRIETAEEFKEAFKNKEDWLMKGYNTNLKIIQDYEDTLEE